VKALTPLIPGFGSSNPAWEKLFSYTPGARLPSPPIAGSLTTGSAHDRPAPAAPSGVPVGRLVRATLLRALIGVPVGLLAFGFIWLVHELDHLLRRSGAPSRRPFRGLSA